MLRPWASQEEDRVAPCCGRRAHSHASKPLSTVSAFLPRVQTQAVPLPTAASCQAERQDGREAPSGGQEGTDGGSRAAASRPLGQGRPGVLLAPEPRATQAHSRLSTQTGRPLSARIHDVAWISLQLCPAGTTWGPAVPPTPSHSAPRARQGPKCTRSCTARPHVAGKGFVQPSAVALCGPASKLSADASLFRNDNLPSAELLGPTGNLTDPGHHLWALRPAGPRPETPVG